MTLEAGATFGPYEIVEPIGAGGMGEVYRARDTRLDRDVALKVLPEGSAQDVERRARFEQEARSASALNHPHIVSLLDIGEQGDVAYIVMELVEGKTLRQLLASGPQPIRRVLDIAVQIVEGLAKAHSAGIVHRNLKPDNVIFSKDGFAKILDFGLAKLTQQDPQENSAVATATEAGTRPGAVLGTVGYMSPEQASGRRADYRADQFALGVLLYELATGERAFQRDSAAETLAATIRDEPEPIAQLRPTTPAPLRWIVERCMAKDPEDRFASTVDLARDLASVREHLSEAGSATDLAAPRRTRLPQAGLLAVAGLIVGLALGYGFRPASRPGAADLTFTRLTYSRGAVQAARFAPDGQTVVYSASWEGQPSQLFSVRFDSPESRVLGLPNAELLSISSTGEMALSLGRRFIFGFETTGTLARAPLGGGTAPREILEGIQEADWSPDGTGLAVVRDAGERRRLEYPIGTMLFETTGWISQARVSPDGLRVAFVEHPERGDNRGNLTVVETADLEQSVLALAPNGLEWSPDGRELWTSGFAAVDLEGNSRRILAVPGGGFLQDVSSDGRLLITRTNWQREIIGLAPGGAEEQNLSWLDWSYPRDVADDGSLVLFEEQNIGGPSANEYAIYLRPTDGSQAVRLGEGRALGLSPDTSWVLAVTGSGEATELVLMPTGAGERKSVLQGPATYESASWFPDGTRVLVSGNEPGRAGRLFIVDLEAGAKQPISEEGVTVYHWRALSPDGRLAVARGPDLSLQIYSTEGDPARPLPAANADDVPIRWTADSRSLFVQAGADIPTRIEVVDVETGARRPWKELTPPDPAGILALGPIRLSADGKSYVYSYRRIIDDLYVVDGVR